MTSAGGDIKTYATSDTDFYALLGITFENSQKDIDRAWRKTALKYHPDKVKPNDTEAKEKFHLAQIGYDLLSDPTTKSLYDNLRAARLQKKRQNELFEGKRRQMKDDLEARERGFKRARTEEEDSEERLQRELRRLAEDGKRRRKEREDALKKEVQQEAEQDAGPDGLDHVGEGVGDQKGVSELDRTVKVRWPREGLGESISQDQVVKLFSKFGKVESVHLLNPKMLRMGRKNKKQLASVCMVQYASIVGAHEAVEDFPKQQGDDWKVFDSVNWAANKEPESIGGFQSSGSEAGSAPSTPARDSARSSGAAFLNMGSTNSTPATSINGDGLRKMPSFSSFASTPKGSPFRRSLGVNSPSLEEITLIRLKNAEKKRLAGEIQRQDEQAAVAEAEDRQA